MRISIFLLLLLAGCTGPVQSAESVLNSYALAAANRADFTAYLSGAALESAQQSEDLLSELGLVSYGSSYFSMTKLIGSHRYQSCLDVSATSFRDANGLELELDRIERQLVVVDFVGDKVSNLELLGEKC